MLNSVVLVGKIHNISELIENEMGKSECKIVIAVSRNYKNSDGIYETDLIECTMFGGVATSTIENCKKGDVIGIRGVIKKVYDKNEIIVEKLTFLSSKKESEEN